MRQGSAGLVCVLAVWLLLGSCESAPQTGPRLLDVAVPGSLSAPAIAVAADVTDLAANGVDGARILATVKDGAGRPLPGRSVFFLLGTRGYTGAAGSLSSERATTDAKGQAVTAYTAPSLDFVPADAAAVVTAMVADPSLEFRPAASVAILLAPKGTPPELEPPPGEAPPPAVPVPPAIASLLPESGPFGTTVVVLGENFERGARVTFVSTFINPPQVVTPSEVSAGRLIVRTPSLSASLAGEADVFVTNPGGLVSAPVKFNFTAEIAGSPVITSVVPGAPPPPCVDCSLSSCQECPFDDWQVTILGLDFDECASVIVVHTPAAGSRRVHELLPDSSTPCDLTGLPATCTATDPSFVPWPHAKISLAGDACTDYAPAGVSAFVRRDSGQIDLRVGPKEVVTCGETDQVVIYVSNDPGSGIGARRISAPVSIPFRCGP